MSQVAQDAYSVLIDEALMAVDAANLPERLDRESVRVLSAQLVNVLARAEAERLVRVANIARQLQQLLGTVAQDGAPEHHAVTLRRGLDLLTLLAQDAERQRAGHPAAALDDAVDCFVDQVERALRGERGARIMRFPRSRTRSAADTRAPCPTPTGIA